MSRRSSAGVRSRARSNALPSTGIATPRSTVERQSTITQAWSKEIVASSSAAPVAQNAPAIARPTETYRSASRGLIRRLSEISSAATLMTPV